MSEMWDHWNLMTDWGRVDGWMARRWLTAALNNNECLRFKAHGKSASSYIGRFLYIDPLPLFISHPSVLLYINRPLLLPLLLGFTACSLASLSFTLRKTRRGGRERLSGVLNIFVATGAPHPPFAPTHIL